LSGELKSLCHIVVENMDSLESRAICPKYSFSRDFYRELETRYDDNDDDIFEIRRLLNYNL
jgi:hypothetical protein